MKLVIGIVQPDRLDAVRRALRRHGIYRITISRCAGRGQAQEVELEPGRGGAADLTPKMRLEIACNDAFVEPAIAGFLESARHGDGEIGDGKIWVLPIEECVRIRTGDRGGSAI